MMMMMMMMMMTTTTTTMMMMIMMVVVVVGVMIANLLSPANIQGKAILMAHTWAVILPDQDRGRATDTFPFPQSQLLCRLVSG